MKKTGSGELATGPGSFLERLFAALRSAATPGRTRALARALSLVEDGAPEAPALLALCREALDGQRRAFRVGITGPAGAGKSTLVDALTRALRSRGLRVGIVAVDPSSAFSGGAILGDRIRLGDLASDSGVYMRSMAARGHLGGLAAATSDVLTAMEAAGFDWLLIETTGVGQGEIEVVQQADAVAVVLVPGMGDSVQSLKAGVLEIASVFVLNKADMPGIDKLEAEIEEMLGLSAPVSTQSSKPAVVRTAAAQGRGIAELLAALDALAEKAADKIRTEGAGGFNPRNQASIRSGALAPEGDSPSNPAQFPPLPAAPHIQIHPTDPSCATGVPSLDHLGIAVRSLDASLGLYRALGIAVSAIEEVAHERVRVAMLAVGGSRIELLEATEPDSAVGRFLARRGEGLHHVALRVADLAASVEHLKASGVRLISDSIQAGAGGHRYVFVHPASANGVLLELVEAAGVGDAH